ncbi:MAG: hypothetical protein A2Y12_16590 [Planctomycetes bacterium GWF2_42_9]|nr:MAG: hypothetical protein A2Y12_16590 [Planctomycetes bacterium GWF2_42_9]
MNDAITAAFSTGVYLTCPLIYLLPVLIVALLGEWILKYNIRIVRPLIYILITAVASFSQIFIFADRTILRMFGFHINGFVWNIVSTPGGIESMGSGSDTYVSFMLIILGFIILQSAIMFILLRTHGLTFRIPHLNRVAVCYFIIGLPIVWAFQAVTYGVCSFNGKSSVLIAANDFPLYMPLTFQGLLKKAGFKPAQRGDFNIKLAESFQLRYPLCEIRRKQNCTNYNIVWLVAESLRSDMVDPNIMPATCKFGQQSTWFQNHFSGGNGTRIALFTMFYGIYGSYWFDFLHEQRGPVLIDLLLKNNYQMSLYTSARFSYPEFDRTVFSSIARDRLHDGAPGEGWQRDREYTGEMLDFIQNREPNRPFFTFMFFESPHAQYYFPPENAIRKPYLEKFNYTSSNLKQDMPLIWNRYVNSCNHLDSQLARIYSYLETNKLLDSTIVIVTGDHGEEFMEKGHWGHNSSFTIEQTKTPLIIWVPGKAPLEVNQLTSHLDISPTIMNLLGIENDSEDYCCAYDLFGSHKRSYTIFSDWSSLAYADSEYKAVFPLKSYGVFQQELTDASDKKRTDIQAFYSTRKNNISEVMTGLSKFSWK